MAAPESAPQVHRDLHFETVLRVVYAVGGLGLIVWGLLGLPAEATAALDDHHND